MPPESAVTRITHHERILGELRDKITSQQWRPGFRLPFETELAEQYGVSRMTMNKVLGQLAREGFLTRTRKRGTFVAHPPAQSAVLEIPDIEAEVEALGMRWQFRLFSRELRLPTPGETAAARPTGGRKPVLALTGVHLADETPFCHETRIINPEVAPDALDQDFSTTAPGSWLVREIPWTSAEHRIRAINATGNLARDLALDPGTACLSISRRTEYAGNWVTAAEQVYPGSSHELFAQFTPHQE